MSDGSKSNESFEVLADASVEGVCNEPLSGALRVTEVDDLLSLGVTEDVLKVSGKIVLSHFVVGEVPELLIVNCVVQMLV